MLNDDQINDLLECEWLPRLHNESVYLAKFRAYPSQGSCIFLLTDTKTVWCEVVKSERLGARYGSLNKSQDRDEAEGTFFRSEALHSISKMHELRNFADTELDVAEGTRTDLIISMSYQSQKWTWEVDSLGHRLSSTILSQHLVIPLIITANFSFNSTTNTSIVNQTAQELQKELDKVAKIAKRNPLLGVAQALKRPRLNSALRRVGAVLNDSESLPPVIAEFPETDEVGDSAPNTLAQEESVRREVTTSAKVTQSTQPSGKRASPPLFERMDSTMSDAPVSASTRAHHSGEGTDETLHTGPSNEGKMEEEIKEDDSATESDSPPPTKKRKVVKNVRTSSPSRSPSRGTPARKKANSSSDSDSPAPASSRKGVGISRVKQPVKRGGRRL